MKPEEVARKTRRMYEQMDPIIKRAAREMNATCRKGCAHCCYVIATITLPCALVLAEYVLGREDWESWLPRLRAGAIAADYDGITHDNYFEKQIPCVFLGADKTCTAYSARPAACRQYLAVSDPANCALGAEAKYTSHVDLGHLEAETFTWAVQTADGLPIIGPISTMTLYGMGLLTIERADQSRYEKILSTIDGLTSPIDWLKKHSEFFVAHRIKTQEAIR